jgi:hypothetical protein
MMATTKAKQKRFKAKLEPARGGGVYVRVPFDVEELFGKKRVPITATIDGEPYRGTLVRMGSPFHCLGVLKAIREKIGKGLGDEVDVLVREDLEERTVEVPKDLEGALKKNKDARTFFADLSYSHRREWVQWIEEAKREETRTTRIAKTVASLAAGKKTR